jgi:hypothetical protein
MGYVHTFLFIHHLVNSKINVIGDWESMTILKRNLTTPDPENTKTFQKSTFHN